ncbi:MAG: polysaccharide deacetylase [Pirellulaceae bacterium]|nr:MAG: polysaccharide deacetylase [Pirellulaceae bacterium]
MRRPLTRPRSDFRHEPGVEGAFRYEPGDRGEFRYVSRCFRMPADNLQQTPLNAFSVDVEDYFHVSAFEPFISRGEWGNYSSRVVRSTQRLLEILAKYKVRATFFVLGWVAEKFPELVKEIASAGHEIGCHSYWHRLIYTMTVDEFREDTRISCSLLADLTGQPVRLYRAPSFSIVKCSRWALDVLAEEGIEIDSSIFPIYHDRYGWPEIPPCVQRLVAGGSELLEYPLAVVNWMGLRIPVGGGGYFRLYPFWLTHHWLRAINKQGRPFVFYIHPWELDPEQPRLPFGSAARRFRHYVNLRYTEDKLDRLLAQFRFGTVGESAREYIEGEKERRT